MFREKKKYCVWKQGEEQSFLEKLFILYPDKNWEHAFLAMNPNISLDFIEKYINKDDIKYTALNPNITRAFIEKHPEVLSCNGLDRNIGLSLDDYIFIADKKECINENKNIHIFYKILKRDNYKLETPDLFWKIVMDNPREKWDWHGLSNHPLLKSHIVRDNPDRRWNWSYLSRNPNITWEIVRDNPDKPWDWKNLSENQNITWEIVRDNPDRPWDWWFLSENPNITWEILKEDLYENLEIVDNEKDSDSGYDSDFGFGEHKNIPEKLDNIYRGKWEFCGLTRNPSITFDIIESNSDLPWDDNFSENPNLILSYTSIEKYDFRDISYNMFLYNNTVYKRKKSRDVKLRQIYLKLIFEKLSGFSRNIDRVIFKRLNYN